MVFFNYSTKEITGKIVYYGPGLCGKTTNLQYIFKKLDPSTKGKMLSLATEADRTLFFDFLPVKLGTIRGMKIRFQLYTVPGQVFYNETRKLVLKGADAIVFVADSQKTMMEANIDSYRNMEENLTFNGLDPDTIPLILQFNKRDLPDISSIEELNEELNKRDVPHALAVATTGEGVIETFQTIGKMLMNEIVKKHKLKADAMIKPGSAPSKEERLTPSKPLKVPAEELEVYHGGMSDTIEPEEVQETVEHELPEDDDEMIEKQDIVDIEDGEKPQFDSVIDIDDEPAPSPTPVKTQTKPVITPEAPPVPKVARPASPKDTPPAKPDDMEEPYQIPSVIASSTIRRKDSETIAAIQEKMEDLSLKIQTISNTLITLRSHVSDIQQLQKQIVQDMNKNQQEIITSRPEIQKSWLARKIFKM